ncbi:hypothetical protein [Rhodoferax sp.]|uniref:hypothetical protein n=1 Tax=Rhodoferax sp. TaxID=50421 RepID=UPI002ACE8449|nr:hypothetical protein [Rhodoferax sp.]MDZ7919464.1 hypothetical protein [Rhodoferax sp.]
MTMATPSHHRTLQRVSALALSLLAGCAGTNWERAFYDGFHRCQTNQTADHAPCPPTKSYERYEQERKQALEREGAAPAVAPVANSIEENQL